MDTINVFRHRAGHYVLSKLPLVFVAQCCTELDWLCEIELEEMPDALHRLIVLQLQFGDWAKLSEWQFFARESELLLAQSDAITKVSEELACVTVRADDSGGTTARW